MSPDLSVYLVTDPGLAASRGHRLPDLVAAAVAGGVTTVQVREKDAGAREFLGTVLAVADAVPAHVAVIVNDRIDVFLAARSAGGRVTGVHVGQDDLPPALVRRLVGPDAVLGLSAATEQELRAAEQDPGRVDYVGIGVVRATTTKADAPPPLGVEGFGLLARDTGLPAVAIGGITASDVGPLRAVGAAGAAVSSVVCAAADPRAAARELAVAWAGAA